ncbi:hypothetical protein NL524_30165, partial [Klebsiella pneumoniae]|nr:hypothetical protein [Klebsiella pneumoniae]
QQIFRANRSAIATRHTKYPARRRHVERSGDKNINDLRRELAETSTRQLIQTNRTRNKRLQASRT